MIFEANRRFFTLDGDPFFLLSGEAHYFRIPREAWPVHLAKMKAAGLNTVSTYIPWSWHEIAEGVFDLDGRTDPQRDLRAFLLAAKEAGLFLSVKPGPYILAEFADAGLPLWLTRAHPEILAEGPEMVSYLHPVFLAYVKRWYDQVLPLLAANQVSRGGNILLMQVCNEAGLFNWLAGTGDYGKVALDSFHGYLRLRYGGISELNQAYESSYPVLESVPPPRDPARDRSGFRRWQDWHGFHRWYYGEYLDLLIKEIRAHGLDLQLFHNVPGWVFGRGTEYPVNLTFYDEILRRHPELSLAIDHIPENPSYRNAHDDLVIDEMTRACQDGRHPIWAAELQAGTREHNVHTFPNEMELFYKACLARGMAGMNFYMFSQGRNPSRRGTYGPTFYWETALSTEGTEQPLYEVIAKIGRIIRSLGRFLLESEKRTGTGVGFYRPYYEDEFFYPVFGGSPRISPKELGLRYEPKIMRNNYFFDGLLRGLSVRQYEYEIVDLQAQTLDPDKTKQLWITALDYMEAKTQSALAAYVRTGGHLILWPGLPDRDLQLNPCTILRDEMGVSEGPPVHPEGLAKIDLLGVEDVNALSPVRTYQTAGAEEIAWTPDGRCCGLTKAVGRGRLTLLGTIFGYNIEEHLDALEKLAGHAGIRRQARLTNSEIQCHLRYGKDYALLALLNYTPVPQAVAAVIPEVPGAGEISLPETGGLVLAPASGLLVPVNLPLGQVGGRLLWSTGEVLELAAGDEGITLTVQGLPLCEAELALNLPAGCMIVLDGKPGLAGCSERVLIRLPRGESIHQLEIKASRMPI